MTGEITLEIRDLVLCVPGLERSRAHALAEDVARRLADELPNVRLLHVPEALELRIVAPPHASADELAAAISDELLRVLR